jgi:hypothetical protein
VVWTGGIGSPKDREDDWFCTRERMGGSASPRDGDEGWGGTRGCGCGCGCGWASSERCDVTCDVWDERTRSWELGRLEVDMAATLGCNSGRVETVLESKRVGARGTGETFWGAGGYSSRGGGGVSCSDSVAVSSKSSTRLRLEGVGSGGATARLFNDAPGWEGPAVLIEIAE